MQSSWLALIERRVSRDCLGVILGFLDVPDVYNGATVSRAHEDLYIYARFGFRLCPQLSAKPKDEKREQPPVQNDFDWLDDVIGPMVPMHHCFSSFSETQLYEAINEFLDHRIERTAMRLITDCYWGLFHATVQQILRDAIRKGCVMVVGALHAILLEDNGDSTRGLPSTFAGHYALPTPFTFTELKQVEKDWLALALDSNCPDMVLLVSRMRNGGEMSLVDLQRAIEVWDEKLCVPMLDLALTGLQFSQMIPPLVTHRGNVRVSKPADLAHFLAWALANAKTPEFERCVIKHLKSHGLRTNNSITNSLIGAMFG